jgi:hypothetical protein
MSHCPGSNAMHAIHAKGAFQFLQANADKIQIVRVAITLLMVGLGLYMQSYHIAADIFHSLAGLKVESYHGDTTLHEK